MGDTIMALPADLNLLCTGGFCGASRHATTSERRCRTLATGTAEREAALEMLGALPNRSRVTVGADKGYDAAEFVEELRALNVTPHIAQNDTSRRSAIDRRTTHHPGYLVSQRKRK